MSVIAAWDEDPLRKLLHDLPELFDRLDRFFRKTAGDATAVDWPTEVQELATPVRGWQADHRLESVPRVDGRYDSDEARIVGSERTQDEYRHRTIKEVVDPGYVWNHADGQALVLKPGKVIIWDKNA